MALIDDWMPVWDEVSRHSIVIDAEIDRVWTALLETDFTRHPVTRLLFALRSLPALLSSPATTIARLGKARESRGLDAILSSEFVLLERRPPAEMVLGLTGRFWAPTGNLTKSDPTTFRDPVPEGLARAAWAFELAERDGATLLATETRILCGGDSARRAFRRYWTLIRPFSGLIRVLLLDQIRGTERRLPR